MIQRTYKMRVYPTADQQQLLARWHQQRRRLARQHARVRDTRADTLHKLTRRLVDENQALCVESLNVRGLARSKLALSVHDAAWGELLRQLRYKAQLAGRTVVAVDQWTATTRRCSACGHKPAKFGLDVRYWRCAECWAEHDRDVNAAINIRELGMARFLPEGNPGRATHTPGDVMRVEGDTHRAASGKRRFAVPASVEARTGQSRQDGLGPDCRG